MKRLDLTGQRFERLTVLSIAKTERGHRRWNCICECGKKLVVNRSNLTSGHTRSCGCLKTELLEASPIKHGQKRRGATTAEYTTWAAMIQRCTNPKNDRYADWGGRGITVCDRWKIFGNFFLDMGPKPKGKTLDRRENEGNYEPSNCRWATAKEQRANRRDSRRAA